jgi:hypothetical protein
MTSFVWATGSNLAGTSRAQRALLPARAAGPSGRVTKAVPGGHGEGLRRTRGEDAAVGPADRP